MPAIHGAKPQSSQSNLTPTYEFIFHLVKGLGYKYEHTLVLLKHDPKSLNPLEGSGYLRRIRDYPRPSSLDSQEMSLICMSFKGLTFTVGSMARDSFDRCAQLYL